MLTVIITIIITTTITITSIISTCTTHIPHIINHRSNRHSNRRSCNSSSSKALQKWTSSHLLPRQPWQDRRAEIHLRLFWTIRPQQLQMTAAALRTTRPLHHSRVHHDEMVTTFMASTARAPCQQTRRTAKVPQTERLASKKAARRTHRRRGRRTVPLRRSGTKCWRGRSGHLHTMMNSSLDMESGREKQHARHFSLLCAGTRKGRRTGHHGESHRCQCRRRATAAPARQHPQQPHAQP